MQRVIAILLGALLCGGTVLALGLVLFRKLRLEMGRGEYLALSFVVGSVCFSQLVFLLCCVGVARKEVFLALGVASAFAAAKVVPEIGTRQPGPALPSIWKGILGLSFALFGLVYLVNALAPEASPDGSAYHLPFVAQYLQAHGFRSMPDNFYASLPQGVELLFLPAF